MKNSTLAGVVLCAMSGTVAAETSVSVFGVADLSANYVKNGSASSYDLASNQLNSNRFGVRASQDLPNGFKASAWLEAGLDNATGVAGASQSNLSSAETAPSTSSIGQLFSRRSTVSLSGNFGEVRMGRDYVPTFRNLGTFDIYEANGFGQAENITNLLGSGAGTQFRANNSVAYFLPSNLGGAYGEVFASAGEGQNTNKYAGARLGWASGPFDGAIAFGETDTAIGVHLKDFNAGGSWTLPAVKLLGLWNEYKFGSAEQNTFELSVSIPIAANELRAGIARSRASGANPLGTNFSGNAATDLSVEYIYNFMKGVSVYAQAATITNKGGATYRILNSAGVPNAAYNKSQGIGAGMRYAF